MTARRDAMTWALGAALLLGGLASLQGIINFRAVGRSDPAIRAVLAHLPYWLLWAGFTPLMWWLGYGSRVAAAPRGGKVALYATAAVPLMVLHSGLLYAWQRLAGLTDLTIPLWQGALGVSYWRLGTNVLAYGAILGLIVALEASRRVRVPEPALAGLDPSTSGKPLSHLVVKHDGRVTLVRTAEIDWIEAADYYARVHAGGKAFLVRESMASLAARLDASHFHRIHRSAIVNLDRIREIQPAFRGEHVVILRDGTALPLNRSRRRDLEASLGQSL